MLLGFLVNRMLFGRDLSDSTRNYRLYLSYNPDDNRIHPGMSELDPRSNSYIIRDIDGLYPSKNLTDMDRPIGGYNRRNEEGQASKASRTITITVGFDDAKGKSITELRTELYGSLRPGDVVELTFITTHMEPVSISGRVESHQSNIFSEESLSQIVIVCPNPDFKGSVDRVETFEVLQNQYTTVPFTYEGTSPGGFEVEIKMPNNYVKDRLQSLYVGMGVQSSPGAHAYLRRTLYTGIDGPFDTLFENSWSDSQPSIFFSTSGGSRSVWHKRAIYSDTRALYRYMRKYSEWLYMHYGMENLWIRLNSTGSGGVVNGTLRYNNMYEGI